jgi:hypothetical protein
MYDEQKRAFKTHINCDEAGKKLILTDFPNMYTSALEDYLLGYAGVTIRELVQYITHTYSRIDPTQLADCYTKMTRPYDLQDPIETSKLPQPKLRQPTYAQTFQCAKLPQPKLRQPTDVQRSQHTLRANQVRYALVREYVELLQNMPLWRLL